MLNAICHEDSDMILCYRGDVSFGSCAASSAIEAPQIRRNRWQTIDSVWVNYDLNMTSLESWELDRVHYRCRILAAWGLTEVPWLIQLVFLKNIGKPRDLMVDDSFHTYTSRIYKIIDSR